MKKALYGLMIAGLISGTALAGGPDVPMGPSFRPFVGVNYSYLSISNLTSAVVPSGRYTGDADNYNGIGFEAGLKYGHYLGFVWGWNHYFSQNSAVTIGAAAPITQKISGESYYFDVRGYWPVMAQMNLIGSVGAGILDMSSDVFVDIGQVNLRLGVGADYWFTHNWGIQGMFNYSPSHAVADSGYSSWWTITAGIYYMFS